MTPPYLSLIESGQRSPSLDALTHIAAKLEVDVDELLTGTPSELGFQLELSLQEARGLALKGELDEAWSELEEILATADRHRLHKLSAKARCVAASVEESRGDYSSALELYDDAQRLLAEEPAYVRFEAVVGYARCTHALGDTRLAAYLLDSYLVHMQQQDLEDPTAAMRVYAAQVQFYRALGLERKSVEAAEAALRLAPQVEDPEQVACMNMNVARSLLDQGRHDDALASLRRAEEIYQTLDWPVPAARAKINAGIVALDKERLDVAYDLFAGAAAALEGRPKERSELGAVHNLLGRVERMRGNTDASITHLEKARKHLTKGDVYEKAMNSHELGLALVDSDPDRAEEELKKAAGTYQAADASPDAARAMLELGRLMMKKGDAAGAARVMEQGLELTAASGP